LQTGCDPQRLDFGRKWVLIVTTMGIMFGKVHNGDSLLKLRFSKIKGSDV